MTSAIKRVLDAMEENKNDWINEQVLEDIRQSYSADATDESIISPVQVTMNEKNKSSMFRNPSTRKEERKLHTVNYTDSETNDFRFENNIDVPMVVTLENYKEAMNQFRGQMTEKQYTKIYN